ncbi:MAG: hypothetical protein AAGM67_02995 [Bacteroidota bacterium]
MTNGCAERQTEDSQSPQTTPAELWSEIAPAFLIQTQDTLPNGTIVRSVWKYKQKKCEWLITETVAYIRTRAPFGGFNAELFENAWQSERRIPLSQLKAPNTNEVGLYLKLFTQDNQNVIEEKTQYTEAYLQYYQQENGEEHPINTDLQFNLISVPVAEGSQAALSRFAELLTLCQAN